MNIIDQVPHDLTKSSVATVIRNDASETLWSDLFLDYGRAGAPRTPHLHTPARPFHTLCSRCRDLALPPFILVLMLDPEIAPEAYLKLREDRANTPTLLDVREPWEAETASIPGATLIPTKASSPTPPAPSLSSIPTSRTSSSAIMARVRSRSPCGCATRASSKHNRSPAASINGPAPSTPPSRATEHRHPPYARSRDRSAPLAPFLRRRRTPSPGSPSARVPFAPPARASRPKRLATSSSSTTTATAAPDGRSPGAPAASRLTSRSPAATPLSPTSPSSAAAPSASPPPSSPSAQARNPSPSTRRISPPRPALPTPPAPGHLTPASRSAPPPRPPSPTSGSR